MLDHVEKIFADMKPMMKKLKKASYKVNMEAFIENHGHYFREMTEYTENASDKETAAKELAVDFTDKVYDAYVSPKKGKIDSAIHSADASAIQYIAGYIPIPFPKKLYLLLRWRTYISSDQ